MAQTYRTVDVPIEIGCTAVQLRLPAAPALGEDLLRTVVPDDVGRWLEGAPDHTSQDDGTAGLDVAIGVTYKLGSWHWKRQKARWLHLIFRLE